MKFGQILLFSLVLGNQSCKKDSSPGPTSPGPTCKIIESTTSLPGNAARSIYTYTSDTILTRVLTQTPGGVLIRDKSITALGNVILEWESTEYSGNTFSVVYTNNGYQPEFAERFLNGGSNFYLGGYDFYYDPQNRLIKVVSGTEQPGDTEYKAEIFYDANGNVSRMEREVTTGPANKQVIVVTGYDDHPNPYAAIPYWKFAMDAFWDNGDPLPLITALSKNNPLLITVGTFSETLVYTYNEEGLPASRTITNKNTNTAPGPPVVATYIETFSYKCD